MKELLWAVLARGGAFVLLAAACACSDNWKWAAFYMVTAVWFATARLDEGDAE